MDHRQGKADVSYPGVEEKESKGKAVDEKVTDFGLVRSARHRQGGADISVCVFKRKEVTFAEETELPGTPLGRLVLQECALREGYLVANEFLVARQIWDPGQAHASSAHGQAITASIQREKHLIDLMWG